ncbi:MAG: hypothetical protein Q8K20_19735 [Gemmobacter sp.]|jgi:hypothetical protein|nr:hypothetical protein [Gemmobacter sp.]
MPVSYKILPKLDLVLVTFSGMVGLQETLLSAGECGRHPDFRPGMKHLFDLTDVTGHERDFPAYFAMQAKVLENLPPTGGDHLLMFLAPTRAGQDMAELVRRTWEGLPRAIVLVHETAAEALATLGLRERSLADVMTSAA